MNFLLDIRLDSSYIGALLAMHSDEIEITKKKSNKKKQTEKKPKSRKGIKTRRKIQQK